MDMSSGSSPQYCANISGTVSAGNTKPSNGSEEESQSKWQTTPVHSSAVRFKIRSAKERKQTAKPDKNLRVMHGTPEDEVADRLSEARDQAPRVQPHSPSPPGPELPSGSGRSNVLLGPECVESPSPTERGRPVWREAGLINRSQSVGLRGKGEEKNETVTMRNTQDFVARSARCSESSEIKATPRRSNSIELLSPSNSISIRIQAYGQGKQDSSRTQNPSAASEPSPTRTSQAALGLGFQAAQGLGFQAAQGLGFQAALERTSGGQSLPSRLQPKQRRSGMQEGTSPLGYAGTSPTLNQPESRIGGPNVSEVTGNQTILDRIGKLYGLNSTELNRDSNSRDSDSRDSVCAKRRSATVEDWLHSSEGTDSNSNHSRSNIASTFGSSSSSYISQRRMASYDADKCGTFPRTFSKVERMNISPVPDTSSILPNRNDGKNALSNMSGSPVMPRFEDRKDVTCLTTQRSEGHRSSKGGELAGLETSLDQVKNTRQEMKKDSQKTSKSPTHVNDGESSPRKPLGLHGPQEPHLLDKGQARPQLSRSMTVDDSKYRKNEEVLEVRSLTIPRKKRESVLEKFRAPSIDSVRSTIHKFEALAQQNQSPKMDLPPRRAFSVTEKSKLMPGIKKSNSDKSLSGFMSAYNLTGDFFSKSEVSEEVAGTQKLKESIQITATDKVRSTVKTHSTAGYKQEHENNETVELLDVIPSEQSVKVIDTIKDDIKTSMINRQRDELDFSKTSHQVMEDMDSAEEQLRNDLSATSSKSSNSKSSRSNYVSRLNLSDFYKSEGKCSLESQDLTRTDRPLKTNLQNGPRDSEDESSNCASGVPDSAIPTLTNGALLRAYSPRLVPLGSPEVHPVEIIPASPPDLSNIGTRIRNENISRWITDEVDGVIGIDGDEEETERGYDSDSGESSVTITSNMSQSDHRSFSLSFVDLCNLGGLDCLPSAGGRAKDEEMWMSNRSASLSSDASILSCVTLLGTEELDCLLDDVRGLGNDTLENYEDVHVVVLHKEVGTGLGFTVAGGVDQNKPITVHRVFPCGAAAHEGSIHEGDQVLSINGTALHNSAHWEALRTLRKARVRGMAVVVLRKGDVIEPQHNSKDSPLSPAGKPGLILRVTLTKSAFDLGFSLEGGVASSLGDRPLTVQKIFQGGPIGNVFPGDELLEIQGQSLGGLRRLEAWNLIKRLPPGPVEVLLHRPHLPR
ncbi:uncharacterized protein LOC143473219 isoform X4 [Brachyhypopomus gauderio]|uniref:uncharacterized protein LOC143473219 isoform X4 n=1 Tax=Brachyhypopomus gauderio TaxID=698409 RepID=UPI0040424852